MSLRDVLVDVLQHYPQAREQDFTGHPLAARIRQEGKAELEAAAGSAGAGLLARGSAGQSELAEVPWFALFDPLVTDGAQRGYYVVYLLHSSQETESDIPLPISIPLRMKFLYPLLFLCFDVSVPRML